mmetsp:Transcript_5723/g.6557  ORF Transcript_5723/g.6557 Transcript_5723/m.6557 type:complete len:170 (+) Transcript_5723:802-1311(+)|eukprot:CAMPEP_0197844004 /NCGR_PEP_ID=MMETSP1438-20131217/971_1 /TAXON_ID=1461541 /ORGANISM="Pterosperma sp., Strain CCMP1384" /LENGTH=169 /DNA_ID=CAMNT_0043454527 /DNA_START=787 /DNA_END=1296 /DNA_ORIENTATION=-
MSSCVHPSAPASASPYCDRDEDGSNLITRVSEFKKTVCDRALLQNGYASRYAFKTDAELDIPQLSWEEEQVLKGVYGKAFVVVGTVYETTVAVSEDNKEVVGIFDPQDGNIHVSSFPPDEVVGGKRYREDRFGDVQNALEQGTFLERLDKTIVATYTITPEGAIVQDTV